MPDVYNRNSVTKKGYNLLAESIATKKPITFTKVVVGDGDDTGLDINTMTGVVSPKMELPIGNGEKGGDGEYVIQAVLSNKTLEHSFFPKEVGLFAKCGDGEEVLYSYSNGGNNVGLMPDKNTPINAEIYNIRTKIGNATNITFVTSDDTYVTKGELTKHNTDPDAHGGLLQKVKTELATHNTDISSHPAITAMIAKILGATNWQENPVATLKDIKNLLGMGGIVAQRLEENGFVKFANGFTIQWGKSNIAVTRTIYDGASNFIIPFTFPPFVAVTNIAPATLDNDNWTSSAVKEITINSFTYMSAQNNVTSIRWGAIGF
nr:MAG TPA: tail-collar fiber protein [Caudoviricetes sp.]